MRKNCSSDREKLLKLDAEGRDFAKFLRPLKEKVRKYFGNKMPLVPGGFSDLIKLEHLEFKLEKKYWDIETCRKS